MKFKTFAELHVIGINQNSPCTIFSHHKQEQRQRIKKMPFKRLSLLILTKIHLAIEHFEIQLIKPRLIEQTKQIEHTLSKDKRPMGLNALT